MPIDFKKIRPETLTDEQKDSVITDLCTLLASYEKKAVAAGDATTEGYNQLASQPLGGTAAFDCLAVTQVQVFPFEEGPNLGHLKGLAMIVLNDQFVIRGLRIMEGVSGLFVSYPQDPFYRGEDFRSICQPITRQLREHIENCVLEKYQAAIA